MPNYRSKVESPIIFQSYFDCIESKGGGGIRKMFKDHPRTMQYNITHDDMVSHFTTKCLPNAGLVK